ncbi:unnamed protein product [Pedinophyceae sp. YPF-701]|nr:unnamed protein product [Pedinophyceae sp. YPF-701]
MIGAVTRGNKYPLTRETLIDALQGVTFVFGPVEPSPSDGPVMRPPPRTVDEDVVVDFAVDFTFMQDLLPSTPTPFTPLETDQFVVKIPHAFVEGDGGLVYDANGHVYHETGHFYTRNGLGTAPLPRKPIPGTRACLHYPKLATYDPGPLRPPHGPCFRCM